jgi:chemotaxis protein CheC
MLQELEMKKLVGTFNDYISNKTCGALSTLLNEPVEHKLIRIGNGCDESDARCLPSESIKMCSVRLNGKGDLHIELLFTTELKHGLKIASKLLGSDVSEIDEMGTSALQEVANILTGSFFNALSENTGFKVDLSTPVFKEGDWKNLILEPTCDVVSPNSDAIVNDAILSGTETGTQIHMLIIQHPEHARKLISSEAKKARADEYGASSNSNLLGGENSAIDDLLADFDSPVESSESNSEIDALLDTSESSSEIDALLEQSGGD